MRKRSMDLQSLASINTVRTIDHKRLQNKARRMQINEKLRLEMCARLQQKLHKTPKIAEEMAFKVLQILKQRKVAPADLSDAALAEIVSNFTMQRQEQISIAERTTRKSVSSSHEQMDSAEPIKRKFPREIKGKQPLDNNRISARGAFTSGGSLDRVIDENDRHFTETQQQQKGVAFELPALTSIKKNRDTGIWEEIVKFSSLEEQNEAQLIKERKLRERRDYTSKLHDQVSQKHQSLKQERERSAEFHRRTLETIRQAEDEERKKEQERLKREHELIASQTQQRVAKQARQEKERAIKKAQEQHAAESLEKERNDELAREKARKEAEKRRVEQVFRENEMQLQQKRLQQTRERELEVKLSEEYIAMEKKKDEARQKKINTLTDNIKKKMKIFDDTAKASFDAKVREEDERVQRYQQEYTNKHLKDECKRRADAEVRSRAQAEYLRVQMQEKKEREEALKHDRNKQADLWKQERIEAENREKIIEQQRVLRNRSQQNVLLEQIRERELRRFKADQSPFEVQINARLLEKIHKQAGAAQSRAENVVNETQNRSRELQEEEQALQHQQS